jgi:hypothetical protein
VAHRFDGAVLRSASHRIDRGGFGAEGLANCWRELERSWRLADHVAGHVDDAEATFRRVSARARTDIELANDFVHKWLAVRKERREAWATLYSDVILITDGSANYSEPQFRLFGLGG